MTFKQPSARRWQKPKSAVVLGFLLIAQTLAQTVALPDEKIFYRSDHYSFVERGVPALMLLGAPEGDPQKWIDRSKEWEKTDYHNPGDVVKIDWDWSGAKTVADVMGIMGLRISDSRAMPNWLPTSRFGKLERGNTKDIPEEK